MFDKAASPVPAKLGPRTIDFPTAIAAVTVGKKITRVEWDDPEIYAVLEKGTLMIKAADGKLHQWIIIDGDLTATDWITI